MTWLVIGTTVVASLLLWREWREAKRWNREIDTLLKTKEKR